MAQLQKSAQPKPADTDIDGPANGVAIKGMTATLETIQAFAREIAQMSEQALDRTAEQIDKLRKAKSMEEAASIEKEFVKESLDHAVQHTRKFVLMLATFPPGVVRPVNVAVKAAVTARNASAAKVGRLSEVAHKAGQNPNSLTSE